MQIRIKGYTFQLSEPFLAGTVISKAEAQALNDLRAENIQNNLRKLVAAAAAAVAEGELLSTEVLNEIQARLTAYDHSYQFVEKHQPQPRIGDIEAEARLVARESAEAQARTAGRELTEAELEADIAQLIGLPAVIEAARDRVAAKRRAVAGSLADL